MVGADLLWSFAGCQYCDRTHGFSCVLSSAVNFCQKKVKKSSGILLKPVSRLGHLNMMVSFHNDFFNHHWKWLWLKNKPFFFLNLPLYNIVKIREG